MSRGHGVAVSRGLGCCNVAWSQCCSVAGTGVVCIEMFFAGPAFRIVNSQIEKKSLWIWIFCRLQAMCCFANSHYAKKITADGKRSAKFPPHRSFLAPQYNSFVIYWGVNRRERGDFKADIILQFPSRPLKKKFGNSRISSWRENG